jgi:hypothetical protein
VVNGVQRSGWSMLIFRDDLNHLIRRNPVTNFCGKLIAELGGSSRAYLFILAVVNVAETKACGQLFRPCATAAFSAADCDHYSNFLGSFSAAGHCVSAKAYITGGPNFP